MRLFEITENKLGDCFRAAGRNILDGDIPDATLVHAMVNGQGPLENNRFEHAWVEVGDVVFDYSNGKKIIMRKEEYYRVAGIDPTEFTRYTRNEAIKKMARTHHWGPWE